jgi:BirA family transcriptional regulator, biotin operon repressor / biotin---[acetyl-CoA-carboxylase] ligase
VPPITLAAGVAVCDALRALGCRASIKWPNDVWIDGKKVAGILTESTTQGGRLEAVALGIGVNVNGDSLPDELAATATTVRLALGHPVDRRALAADLLARLEAEIDRYRAEGAPAVAADWRERAGMLGREVHVTVNHEQRSGIARDIDDEGALWVDSPSGPFRVVAGEVTL